MTLRFWEVVIPSVELVKGIKVARLQLYFSGFDRCQRLDTRPSSYGKIP